MQQKKISNQCARIKKNPYELDNQDENGKTVLINIVELRDNNKQIWVLLDYEADPNIQDIEGKTTNLTSFMYSRSKG